MCFYNALSKDEIAFNFQVVYNFAILVISMEDWKLNASPTVRLEVMNSGLVIVECISSVYD